MLHCIGLFSKNHRYALYLGVNKEVVQMYGVEKGGGWNRTHGTVEGHKQLDSFSISNGIPEVGEFETIITWKDGNRVAALFMRDYIVLGYKVGGREIREEIQLSRVSNGFGGRDRVYFLCPDCYKRVQLLYLRNGLFRCRSCLKLNYAIQQETKNEGLHARQMFSILRKDFGVVEDLSCFDAAEYRPAKPKWMRRHTYNKKMARLHKAQMAYLDASISSMCRIVKMLE